MKSINFAIPALIASIGISFLPSVGRVPSGYWENADTYVYYTREYATFQGENSGVSYFETSDGNVWGAYLSDPDFQDGETVTLTFENQESREEYVRAEEYGIESRTRIDNARITDID